MGESSHERESREDPLDARIGQIFNDFLDRKARGEAVSEADLLADHPEFADELRGYFDLVQDLRPGEESVDRLIEQGILKRPSDGRYLAELGPYKITGLLGRGGMGIVLKAHEASLDRTVALKILRPDLIGDATALRRFTREAKAAAALRNTNIVTVYAVGDEGDTSFIAMEYIEGPTLADVIREQGALPVGLIRHIFRQMLQGLAAAHDAGLIHRDIKPSNILLDNSATGALSAADPGVHGAASVIVKLADFGLARMVSAQTRMTAPGSTPGTPEYMSPEQARGDDNIDHRTDLYSAGVVLYEMLTGQTPFNADTPSAVIYQILHTDPPDPRTISETADPHLAGLAIRLMAKRAKDRFESSGKATVVFDTSKRVPSLERRRRHLWWSLRRIAAIALVAAVAWLSTLVGGQSVSPALEDRLIRDVDVDPDRPTVIRAWHGDETEPRMFYGGFPREVGAVTEVRIVDPDGVSATGDELVVAGVERALDGDSLFAFSLDGRRVWGMDLSDPRDWPDCVGKLQPWRCNRFVTGDFDDKRGEEIVVAANAGNNEYPTRVSIIKPLPQEGVIISTFWHMGHIAGLFGEPNFFGGNRPAIVAWGVNNKLDGFGDQPKRPYETAPGEDEPRTEYNHVPIIMILDPQNMSGIGPPRAPHLLDLAENLPFAYAFLDLPNSIGATYVPAGEAQRKNPKADDTARIANVARSPFALADGTAPWWKLNIYDSSCSTEDDSCHRNGLVVDRALSFRNVAPTQGEVVGSRTKFWKGVWRPVIQNFKYVRD